MLHPRGLIAMADKESLLETAIRFLITVPDAMGAAICDDMTQTALGEIGEFSELADEFPKRALAGNSPIPDRLRVAKDNGLLPGHLHTDWMWLRKARNVIRHDKTPRSPREVEVDRLRAREVMGRIVPWYVEKQYGKRLAEPAPNLRPEPPLAKKASRSRESGTRSGWEYNLEDVLLVAFYLAKYEHEDLRMGNQGETFAAAARQLDVKVNTLKNHRDRFDPLVGSGRKGWWQVELSGTARAVFDRWDGKSEGEVLAAVKRILGL